MTIFKMMSSESDSDTFFDAEEYFPLRIKPINTDEKSDGKDEMSTSESSLKENVFKLPQLNANKEDVKKACRNAKDNLQRRRKVEESRKQMFNDDDDVLGIHSEQSSIASSYLEGFYPKSNFNYVLKSGERNDTNRVISLRKVGSILRERDSVLSKDADAVSIDSKYSIETESVRELNVPPLPNSQGYEPDVVASTKTYKAQYPVKPPRRKKKDNLQSSSGQDKSSNKQLPTPDPVESLVRELEYSLDLHSATQGQQYVVKAKDREQDRSEGSKERSAHRVDLSRSESSNSVSSKGSLNALEVPECKNSFEDIKQQPYMVRTRSDSGRPLTDQNREQDRAEGSKGRGAHRVVLSRSESLHSVSSKGSLDALEVPECKKSSEDSKQQSYMVTTSSDSGRPQTNQDREQERAERPNGGSAHRVIHFRSESLNSVSAKGSLDALEVSECKKSSEDSKQQPYMAKTLSDSGRPLTDQEILAQITVRNLDTGEQIPLSLADEHLPKCLNPLSQQLMGLTSECVSTTALDKMDEGNSEMRKSDSLDMGAKMLHNVTTALDKMDEDNSVMGKSDSLDMGAKMLQNVSTALDKMDEGNSEIRKSDSLDMGAKMLKNVTTAFDKMNEDNSVVRKSYSLDIGAKMLQNVFRGRDFMKRIKLSVSRIRSPKG